MQTGSECLLCALNSVRAGHGERVSQRGNTRLEASLQSIRACKPFLQQLAVQGLWRRNHKLYGHAFFPPFTPSVLLQILQVKRRQALLSCYFLFSFRFFFISCPNQCIVSCSADSPNVPAARLGCLLQLPRRESERAADVNSADPTTSTLQASAPGRESGAVRTQTDPMLISAALMIISRAASALLSYRTRWKRGLPLGFVWGFVCLLVFPLSLCY